MKPATALLLVGSAMGQLPGNFPSNCWNVTVLHSVALGWNDGCLGLKHKTGIATEFACMDQCHKDMLCSIWQWVKHENGDLKCWSGNDVHGCKSRSGDLTEFTDNLVGGERIQHGNVRVVSKDVGQETMGLQKYVEDTGNESEKIARCRLGCHGDVACTVWQYAENACWKEEEGKPKGEVGYSSDFAKAMNYGESIEHYCAPPPTPPAEEPFPSLLVFLGIIVGLLALAAIAYHLLKKTPKAKKTRAVKITPKEEAEEEPEAVQITTYFIPQPTMLVQQPVATQYTPVLGYSPVPTGPAYSMTTVPAYSPVPTTPAYGVMPAMV